MGILGNFSVYGLMVLPLAMLVRGKNISLSRLVLLMVASTLLHFALSILRDSVEGLTLPSMALEALVIPAVEVFFFHFVLTDPKAVKVLHLEDAVQEESGSAGGQASRAEGDTAAAVAVVWCLTYTIFFRWNEWYRSMSSLGFEPANLISGVEAFCQLLVALTMCRWQTAGAKEGHGVWGALMVRGAVAAAAVSVGSLPVTMISSAALYILGPSLASMLG